MKTYNEVVVKCIRNVWCVLRLDLANSLDGLDRLELLIGLIGLVLLIRLVGLILLVLHEWGGLLVARLRIRGFRRSNIYGYFFI